MGMPTRITAAETVASNVRAYRQLRGMDQGVLAGRLRDVGIAWRQVTVSEVERNQRSVTVQELLALAFALGTTILQLLDTRGPERIEGPLMALVPESSMSNLGIPLWRQARVQSIRPEDLTALVCAHEGRLVAEWDDDGMKSFRVEKAQPR